MPFFQADGTYTLHVHATRISGRATLGRSLHGGDHQAKTQEDFCKVADILLNGKVRQAALRSERLSSAVSADEFSSRRGRSFTDSK